MAPRSGTDTLRMPPALLLLALVAASSAPLLASATSCTAAVLHNVASGRCLYHTGEDAGSPHTWGCWQDPNMLIEQDPVGPHVRLRQKWTGQCYYVWTADLAVYTWECWDPGSGAQWWDKLHVGGSATKHRYKHVDTGRCLEVDAGGNVLSSPCSEGNPRQVFSWSLYQQTGWSPPHSPMAQYHRPTPANDPCSPFEPNLPGRPYVRPYHFRHACPDDGITFEDLKPWHDPASWGPGAGVPEADGTDVVLPVGVNMLIVQCSLQPSVYGRITIPAGTRLIFADTAIFMKTKGISLRGELWIGSETCRSHAPIHIEFHGLHSEHNDGQPWRKGLVGSMGSRLEMHGKHYVQTWSRLAKTAEKNDTIIYLQDRVNWDKNQEIVIVTSHFKDEPNRNEVRRIKNVWQRAIELYEPLSYQHYGGESYQVEVGLLSRNVMVRGDNGGDTHSNYYGGHVMSSGDMRVESIQAYLMGQRNKIARYPFHFHMGDERPENYVRDCSVYKSFYRCVTVHGTWGSTVSRNVCYDAWGHGYYIEDGVEEQNTISYNLAAYIHVIGTPAEGDSQTGELFHETDGLRQPSDSTASGFYISNAQNYIYGNAASGGWSGYAFPKLDSPIGDYTPGGGMSPDTILPQNIRLNALNPGERPVLEFDGNTAHTTAYVWSDSAAIYVGGLLWTADGKLHYDSGRSQRDPKECFNVNCMDYARVFNNYTNIKVALCDQGFGHWGKRVEVYNYEMYDGRKYGTILDDALVAFGIKGRTSNYHPSGFGPVRDDPMQVRGFEAYDQEAKTILHDIDFRDMRSSGYSVDGGSRWWNDACAISGNTQVDRTKPDAIFALNHIRYNNNTYQNHFCLNAFDNSGTRYFNYIDYDGYSTNRPQWGSTFGGSSLQNDDPTEVSHWWQAEAACELEPEWHLWVCPRRNNSRVASMMVTVQANSFMRLADFDYIDENNEKHHVNDWTNEAVGIYAGKTFLFGNTDGNKPPGPDWNRWAHMTRNANGVVGPSNMGWLMHFDDGTPDNVQLFPKAMPPGSWVIVALQYPPGTTFNIYSNHSKWSGGMHVWETGCPNSMGTCMTYTEVSTFEELRNSELEWVDLGWLGPGPLDNEDFYYFDGTHLYLKIRSWARDRDEFERYGSSLWTHRGWERGTVIEANCPAMEPALEEQNFGNVAYNMCAYSLGSEMWAWTCWGDPAFLFYQDIIELNEFGMEIGVGPIARHEHEDEVVRLRQKATNKCLYANLVLHYVYQTDCTAHPAFYWTRILDKKSNNYDSVYRNHYTNNCLTIQVTSADQGRLRVATCPDLNSEVPGEFLFRCKRDIHLVPRCQKQAVSIPSYDTIWEPYVPRPDYYWANDGPYTGCNAGCEGENCRSVVCRQQESGNIVADSNCDDSDKLYKDSRTCSPCSGPCDGSPCCSNNECEGFCVGCEPAHYAWSVLEFSLVPQVDGVCACLHSGQCRNAPHQICTDGVCIDGSGLGQPCAGGSICGEGLQCNTLCNRCVSATGDLGGNKFCLADSECKSNNCQGESGCTAGVCTHPLATTYMSKNPCTKVIELSAFTSKSVQKIAVDLEPLLQEAFERHHNLNQEIPPSGNVSPKKVQTSQMSAGEAKEIVLRQQFADEYALQQEENITLNDTADPPVYSFECLNRVGRMEEDTLVAGLNTIECTVRKLDNNELDTLLVKTNYHVIDRLKPTMSCPPNLYMVGNREHDTYVELDAPHVRDLGDAKPTVEHDAPKGFLFPSGKRTTVIWTATDAAGNTAKCSHSVTIAECEVGRDAPKTTCFPEPDYSDEAIIPSLDPYWDSYDPQGDTEQYLEQQSHPNDNGQQHHNQRHRKSIFT